MIKCPKCDAGHLSVFEDYYQYDRKGRFFLCLGCNSCSFSGYWKLFDGNELSLSSQIVYWKSLAESEAFDMSWEEITGREWRDKQHYFIE